MIAHNVYFALTDNSDPAVEMLLAACRRYLAVQPGIVSSGCGTLAADHDREVNERDWEVGLHIVFVDKAAHDRYQVSPPHLQFVTECRSNWRQVRVFDTVLV